MTGAELRAWRKRMGFSRRTAAERLGIGKSTIEVYESGVRYDRSTETTIPESIDLACQAIEAGEPITSHKDMIKSVDPKVLRARHMRVDGSDFGSIAKELGVSELTARRYAAGIPTPTDPPPRSTGKKV